jgi:hypothetical protein
MPIGSAPNHIPSTIIVTGSVARPLSAASIEPRMLAVAAITVLLPPASAWAAASTTALRRASASSTAMVLDSAIADIDALSGKPGRGPPF